MSVHIHSDLINNEQLNAQPLTHARICYKSVTGSITGHNGQYGAPLINAFDGTTYNRYRPVGAVSFDVIVDCLVPQSIDYYALQCAGIDSLTLEESADNATWFTIDSISVTSENTILALIPETSSRYYRLSGTGLNIDIVNIKIGMSLAMERAIFAGNSPMNLSPNTVVRPNVSETGQWLGASVQRTGYSAGFSWDNLTNNWYRSEFDLFTKSQPRANPFYLAWRPLTYQSDVTYCLATSDIAPVYTGTRDFMSVSLNVEGFANAS